MNKAKTLKGADILAQAGITLFFAYGYEWPQHDTFANVWCRWLLCLGTWQFFSLLIHLAAGERTEKVARKVYLVYWGGGILLTLLFLAASFIIIGAPFLLLMIFAGLPLLVLAYWVLCIFELFLVRSSTEVN